VLIFSLIRQKPAKCIFWALIKSGCHILGFICFFLFLNNTCLFAQCPQLNSENTKTSFDKNSRQVTILTTSETDFISQRVIIWEYDEAVYYYDSKNKVTVKNVPELIITISSKKIFISGLPSGDYSVIIDKEGCKQQVIGLGYSGFPNSGIRME
jgi:hypothetical protein